MSLSSINRPTWVEINTDNLAYNLHSAKQFIGSEIKYMAVVKADAYGHGAVVCSRNFEREGIDWLGVALPEEAFELRNAGINTPILCLGGFWPAQEDLLLETNVTPVVFRLDQAEAFNKAALNKGVVAELHIKIDTGMGRIGIRFDEIAEFIASIKQFKNIWIDGLMTHFAAADNLAENEFTNLQIERFYNCVDLFKTEGFNPTFIDLANSPGAVAHKNAKGNMVRLGGILYGLGGDILPQEIDKPNLKPVLSLHSRIAHLKRVPAGESLSYGRTFFTERDSLIASVPIGYHDGYPRSLSNKSQVIIRGKHAPVVGRISMDWTLVDVSDLTDAAVGDHVTLIGEERGCSVKAEELAALSNTISYEITCGISNRVRKLFL